MSDDHSLDRGDESTESGEDGINATSRESLFQQVRRRLPELATLALTFYTSNPDLFSTLSDARRGHGKS